MTGERTAAEPLRPRDPRTLGPYALVGRLGQGGMGTVYLARSADGTLVAVKVVRADLAPDDEFRRRFRSEVNRARQVPPFCTAEVLDADPDHETPYLVVEYVDGPSLADVVQDRGPLTAANLHSVAIGVATALTAIHGAGVIHRDLKPRNVLLAPGSPKVIDFGIARALESTSAHTGTDQMVGTVAYMAPERFGPEADSPLTPAADVFAWGAVVAYAGTGRTPFSADSPTATAARILTQPPDLTGLTGTLRDLVRHTLEKDPANRPSARELLDLLVSGPQRPAATAAALADQPNLRVAAEEAQAVTGLRTPGPLTTMTAAPDVLGLIGYHEESIVTQPMPVSPAGPAAGEPEPRPRARRWVLPIAVALVILAVVAGAGMLVMSSRVTGVPQSFVAPPPPASAGPQPAETLIVNDPLRAPLYWQPSQLTAEHASCSFDGALVVRRAGRGTFRCRGPQDAEPDDTRTEVGVRLRTPDSCATIWFRFKDNKGYQVRVCQNNVYVGTHKSTVTEVYRTFPLGANPIPVGGPSTRVTVTVAGDTVTVLRDGDPLGEVPLTDPAIKGGRVLLGVFSERNPTTRGPYEVAFDNVSIYGRAAN